ncbi:hypothetical protein B0H13DRAFT_2370293 [Mycena leptocephala]|nr:hypothetical protein B0H13DRAFT_2370293 [Mycena leptocephala]
MDNLSQELVDLIIDHVAPEFVDEHSDELYSDWKDHYGEGVGLEFASVARCGLVCKTWLPRSRYRLFSTIQLSNDHESGAENIGSFLNLVATSPLPLSFVQSLDLDLLGGPLNPEDMAKLFNLPVLTSLRLRTPDGCSPHFYPNLARHIPLLAISSPLLSRFHLDLNEDLPLPFLIHLISSLPSLEYLRIGGLCGESCDIINPDPETAPQPTLFPQGLLTLELILSCGAGLLFTWLLSLPAFPIRSLSLSLQLKDRDVPIDASLHPVEEYLCRAGSQLESLSLSLSREFLDEQDYSSIDHSKLERRLLTSASALSTVTFVPSQGASAVPRILSFLPSSHLSTLTIVLEEDEELPWGQIDQALSDPKFETLQRFALEDARAGLKTQVSLLGEEARVAMPLASARGILYSRFSAD